MPSQTPPTKSAQPCSHPAMEPQTDFKPSQSLFMMLFPTSIIASGLNTSLIFFQISSNQSLIAFHFSSMVLFTLSQISESLSLIASKIDVARALIAFHNIEANALIAFQRSSQEVLIFCKVPVIVAWIRSIKVFTISFMAFQMPL